MSSQEIRNKEKLIDNLTPEQVLLLDLKPDDWSFEDWIKRLKPLEFLPLDLKF